MQNTIYPFLIAKSSNEGILREVSQKMNFIDVRKIILNEPTSLMNYLGQMRNFSANTHMVIDTTAIEEKGEDFLEALDGIKLQRDDMRLIIYAVDMQKGDEFLDRLVNSGYTNIVASLSDDIDEAKRWEQIKKDLQDCFSEEGLPAKRWKTYRINNEQSLRQRQEAINEEKANEIKIPDFKSLHTKICVFGTDAKVGTTTAVLTLASYFAAGNADVKVVLQSEEQIGKLSKYFGAGEQTVYTHGDNTVFTADGEEKPQEKDIFNVTIFDMGKYGSAPLQENALNIIVADMDFERLSDSIQQLDSANIMEDEPYKVIVNLCTAEQWEKFAARLIDKNAYDFAENPPLLLPFVEDKMKFLGTENNISNFNTFLSNYLNGGVEMVKDMDGEYEEDELALE